MSLIVKEMEKHIHKEREEIGITICWSGWLIVSCSRKRFEQSITSTKSLARILTNSIIEFREIILNTLRLFLNFAEFKCSNRPNRLRFTSHISQVTFRRGFRFNSRIRRRLWTWLQSRKLHNGTNWRRMQSISNDYKSTNTNRVTRKAYLKKAI